jgi:hypothetical protein
MDVIKNYISSIESESENIVQAVNTLRMSMVNKEPSFMRFSNLRKYIRAITKTYSSGEILEPVYIRGVPLLNKYNIRPFLFQLLYFGFAPDLLPSNDVERLGIIQHYFKWEYLNDENRKSLWTRKVITKRNFSEGFGDGPTRNEYNSWSNRQLNAFFISKILPVLVEITGIKIDLARHSLSEGDSPQLASQIEDFINEKVCKGLESIRYLEGEEILERIKSISENGCLFEKMMLKLKWRQYERKNKVKNSLKNAMKRLKEKKSINRFKWQDICAELSKIRLDELQDLAFIEKIPHYLLMTKRELCAEFAKTYEFTISKVSKVQPMCINTTSILGTDVNKISPEFFYSYQHNGKIFCDDIRELNKHFSINGSKHPIDRSDVGNRLVKNVNEWFNYLTSITTTMDDFEEEEEIPTKSLLSSKSATLASVLNYPNSISLFINSSSRNLTKFLNLLQEQNIISSYDISSLKRISSLDSKKTLLVDLLLMKIRNDPEQEIVNGSVISTVQINISNIYNNVFK